MTNEKLSNGIGDAIAQRILIQPEAIDVSLAGRIVGFCAENIRHMRADMRLDNIVVLGPNNLRRTMIDACCLRGRIVIAQ